MSKVTTAAETAKMKISTTYTETKSFEKEIAIPYFFKDEYGYLYKIVSEDYAVSVRDYKDYWTSSIVPASYFKQKIGKGEDITEVEFEAAYSQAMMYIDLIYRNEQPSNEVDENVQIDQMIYGGGL